MGEKSKVSIRNIRRESNDNIKNMLKEKKISEDESNNYEKDVQKSIGYLPEHNPLYLEMYVKEYLAFNADVYNVDKSKINDVIQQTGLSPEAHKKIGQLSKGYRQRVGLAAALLHDLEAAEDVAEQAVHDPGRVDHRRFRRGVLFGRAACCGLGLVRDFLF